MKNEKRSYSSTQVNLPDELSSRIIKWGKDIPDDHIFRDPDNPDFGRENEIHVTVLYGLHTDSPVQVKELVEKQKPFQIELGKISIFSSEVFDVVKIGVKSKELHLLNRKLTENLIHTNKFKTYEPHVTIAYVQKGKGWKYDGNDKFEGVLFEADHIYFSSLNDKKTKINLA